ncbi:MAG: hypothetical protein AAF960_27550 [Bacteroidota bacterium]
MKDYSIYKFAIKQILESKAGHLIPTLKKELMQKLDISRVWLSKILNARVGSKIKLDHIQLSIFADVLQCSIDDLITPKCRVKIRQKLKKKSVATAA